MTSMARDQLGVRENILEDVSGPDRLLESGPARKTFSHCFRCFLVARRLL